MELSDDQCEDVIRFVARAVAIRHGFKCILEGGLFRVLPFREEGDETPWSEREREWFEFYRTINFDHDAGEHADQSKRYSTSQAVFDLREIRKRGLASHEYIAVQCEAAARDLREFLAKEAVS